MVYVAGGGAGVSTSGQLFAGPWMSIGFLKEYGIKKMKGTLDPKALKQAGVIFTGTLTNL
ncbi:MAG: hypothetical protein LBP53_04610 [Candidatus Peribacteria bacterium]|jgi:hypothetical protein|nr:hypothetical protein [Candidatus Peribacteria bacterium]